MTFYEPAYGAHSGQDDRLRDEIAYRHAEEMLNRHGISYVYCHPEILLGIIPGTALAERWYARRLTEDRPYWQSRSPFAQRSHGRSADNVLRDILEGYQSHNRQVYPGDPREHWERRSFFRF